jgi:hypothetical protein
MQPGYSQKVLHEEQGESFVFDEPLSSNSSYNYVAAEYIKMVGESSLGFSYSPQPGEHFNGKINSLLVFPPYSGEFGGTTLNDNGGVVGSIPGNINVNAAGAAQYDIPIEAPPGINGMVPNIHLTYNSAGGNGILGIGWNITGLSVITRTATTIYNDGFIDGVDFDENDQLELDGNRLIPLTGVENEYRTEFETFSKVEGHDMSNGCPTWFRVYTKDGLIMEYGNSEDSKIEAPGRDDVMKWCVNKITDRKGNYINFHYNEINGVAMPSIIDYTGNTVYDPMYSITFHYQNSRPDPINFYLYGSEFLIEALLDSVIIKYEGMPIRKYEIEYNLTGIFAHLERITLWDRETDTKYNPTMFSYGTENEALLFEPTNIIGTNNADLVTGDFNGDGKTDLIAAYYIETDSVRNIKEFTTWSVFYASGTSGTLFQKVDFGDLPDDFSHFISLDFNGDGMDDIAEINQTIVYCRQSTGSAFGQRIYCEEYTGYIENHAEFAPVDFNGNGMDDLLLIRKVVVNTNQYIYRINGYEYRYGSFHHMFYDENGIAGFNFESSFDNLVVLPGDYNGDGKTDLLIETSYDVSSVYSLNETEQKLEIIYDENFNFQIKTLSSTTIPGDINGDGITDLVTVDHLSPPTLMVHIFNGKNDFITKNFNITFPETTHLIKYDSFYNYMVADFNGDGLNDILLGYVQYARNNAHEEWEFKGRHCDIYYSTGTNVFIKVSHLKVA